MRSQALEHGYLVEPDPNPVGFRDEPLLIIRPSQKWPYAFGCRIHSIYGRIESIER